MWKNSLLPACSGFVYVIIFLSLDLRSMTTRTSSVARRTTTARYRPEGEMAASTTLGSEYSSSSETGWVATGGVAGAGDCANSAWLNSISSSVSGLNKRPPPRWRRSVRILCGADPPFERDARDFEAAAEIADVLRHPFLGLRGTAGANGGHQPLLRIGDARARLWNLVDHGAECRDEQLHQRLVRQHEHAVVRGFTHGVKEVRCLFNGAARVDLLAMSRHHGLEVCKISRLALARRR